MEPAYNTESHFSGDVVVTVLRIGLSIRGKSSRERGEVLDTLLKKAGVVTLSMLHELVHPKI